jgi:hypothetical protein
LLTIIKVEALKMARSSSENCISNPR